MAPHQRKPWAAKFTLFLLLCLLVIAVGIGFWVASVRDRKWSAFIARVDELRAQSERPAPERLSFDRDLHPGNAWDDYLKANPWVPGQPPLVIRGKINPFLERRKEADRAEVESLVARYGSSITLVSSGARRREATVPRQKYGVGGAAFDPAALCIAKARFLAEDGKPSEALELLADVCMVAWDVTQTGLGRDGSSGLNMLRSAFREVRDMVQSREIAEADLLKLDRRLQNLDERFPDAEEDLRNDLLELGSLILSEDQRDEMVQHDQGRTRRSWRYLFSSRLQAAHTFSTADQMVHRALEARKLPFRDEEAVVQALYREKEASKDPLLGFYSIPEYQTVRWTRGDLRLLRFAVHYRVTGETLDLDSPFGGKIQFQFTDGTLLAWHPAMFKQPPKSGPTNYQVPSKIEVPRRPGK